MKGIRFYEEFSDAKTRRESAGNIVAIETAYKSHQSLGDRVGLVYEGYAGVFTRPNSPVATSGIAEDFLREYCRPVSESHAREVHPRLFEYLEEANSVA